MIVAIDDADDPRLAAFHAGIYAAAFPLQQEPLAAWRRALRGEAAYAIAIALAVEADAIVAGVIAEHYPRSRCGLVTYLAVAPSHRRRGLGEALLRAAAEREYAAGARAVFGEVDDPRVHGTEVARARLARFVRWGARVADVRYIQPALGEGLARDARLCLIVVPGDPARALPTTLAGADVRAFVDEFYAATEHGPPPAELVVPDRVALRDTSSG